MLQFTYRKTNSKVPHPGSIIHILLFTTKIAPNTHYRFRYRCGGYQILPSNYLVYILNSHFPPSIPFFAYAINSKFSYQRLQPVYRRTQGKKDRSHITIFTVGSFLKQSWNGYLKRIIEERRNFKLALSSLRNVAERISSRSSMQQACICAIERGWCRCNWQPCRAVCQPRLSAGSRVYRTSFSFYAATTTITVDCHRRRPLPRHPCRSKRGSTTAIIAPAPWRGCNIEN